jgi:hypothetical protein
MGPTWGKEWFGESPDRLPFERVPSAEDQRPREGRNMAEPQKAIGINVPLLESLVKKHFGSECTGKLSWSVTKGRYVPSDLPRRLAAPQKLFGVRLWWQTIGEFSENIGFRLELWRGSIYPRPRSVAEYNAETQGACGTRPAHAPALRRRPVVA